jgi:hypothetical protein
LAGNTYFLITGVIDSQQASNFRHFSDLQKLVTCKINFKQEQAFALWLSKACKLQNFDT